jgi:hypothetical protein
MTVAEMLPSIRRERVYFRFDFYGMTNPCFVFGSLDPPWRHEVAYHQRLKPIQPSGAFDSFLAVLVVTIVDENSTEVECYVQLYCSYQTCRTLFRGELIYVNGIQIPENFKLPSLPC